MDDSKPQKTIALPTLPERDIAGHKGSYGKALLIGGSTGMAGAIGLAGIAALRSGVGLALLGVPQSIRSEVASYFPCYTTLGLPESDGGIDQAAWDVLAEEDWHRATAVGLGPGMGQGEETVRFVRRMFTEYAGPIVVDADALNALATAPEHVRRPAGPRVLTPHPGEFVRLAQALGADSQLITGVKSGSATARIEAAQWLAARDPAQQTVVVLKGHGSVVASDRAYAVNCTGNPGMASGGTGDVLTGVIAALLSQGLPPANAARLGVHVHGMSGDLASATLGQIGLTAWDVAHWLPQAFLQFKT